MSLVIGLAVIVMAITLHEFAHAWAGDRLGDSTARLQGRLTLNPVAHIDPIFTLLLPVLLILANSPVIFGAARPVPFNPWALKYGRWGAALVAAAGPATNFLLAIFFAAWLRLFNQTGLAEVFYTIISINVAFGVFNLIPFPPLDGSRILYAAAPAGVRSIMDSIEKMGLAAVMLFLFIGFPLLQPFMGAIVGTIMEFLIPGLTSLGG